MPEANVPKDAGADAAEVPELTDAIGCVFDGPLRSSGKLEAGQQQCHTHPPGELAAAGQTPDT
eukprot:3710923-Amphidinium_carterae.1